MRRQPRCDTIVEMVTDYLEAALPRASCHRFEHHLRRCRDCATYLAQMRATIRAVASGR